MPARESISTIVTSDIAHGYVLSKMKSPWVIAMAHINLDNDELEWRREELSLYIKKLRIIENPDFD